MDHACHRIQVSHIWQEFQSFRDQDAHSATGEGMQEPVLIVLWAVVGVRGGGVLRAVIDLYLELARPMSTYQSLGS